MKIDSGPEKGPVEENSFFDTLVCPRCNHAFRTEVSWDNSLGYCPKCNLGWALDEVCNDDYSDCNEVVDWDLP